jgi:alpha/beta superfamily hydrolase
MITEENRTLEVAGLRLEARLFVPPSARGGLVLCHPHPLYGGEMDNPVVLRMAEAAWEMDVATIRFNFRGVGRSAGSHDAGIGEQDDALAALDLLADAVVGAPLAVTGYSFGAWIGALAGSRDARVRALALIAPALAHHDFGCLEGKRVPTLLVGGDSDAYCPAGELRRLAAWHPWARAVVIENADHFFVGRLAPLGDALAPWLRELAATD